MNITTSAISALAAASGAVAAASGSLGSPDFLAFLTYGGFGSAVAVLAPTPRPGLRAVWGVFSHIVLGFLISGAAAVAWAERFEQPNTAIFIACGVALILPRVITNPIGTANEIIGLVRMLLGK